MKQKMVIYQVLPRLFGNDTVRCIQNGSIEENGCGKLADFTTKALHEIKALGATHIWYTGLLEHSTQTNYGKYGIKRDHPAVVKGKAGSPYAIKDYYDIDPDLAVDPTDRLKEFEELLIRTHRAGLKMIIDFVPNHVARQYHSDVKPRRKPDFGANDDTTQAFNPQNNFYYCPGKQLEGAIDFYAGEKNPYVEMPAKATGNDRFDNFVNIEDWYETVKLNYGVDYCNGHRCCFSPIPDTWEKMKDILTYWADKGIDGFRCDMAEMVPCEFWGWVIPQIKELHPDIVFIAEVYNPNEYRNYIYNGKFDFLYDKVGLYDTLRGVTCNNLSASNLTACWERVNDIQEHMLNFMENHDEQRIASDFYARIGVKGKPGMIVCATMNTNPVMVYFGQELGEKGMNSEGFSGLDGRTTIFDYWNVDTIRRWRNGNQYDTTLLNAEEQDLRNFYKRLLTLCNEERAIKEGQFFDLMYVNHENWNFNDNRLFAYLRKYGNELLLIAVNFSDMAVNAGIRIPMHAFEFFNLPSLKNTMAVDLLSNTKMELSILPDKETHLKIEGNNGKIYKITI